MNQELFDTKAIAKDTTEWTPQNNVQAAKEYKDKGNYLFQCKDYAGALRQYHKANTHLAGIVGKGSTMASFAKTVVPHSTLVASEDISQQSEKLKFSVYLNMGQVYILQQKFEKGRNILNKAAQIKTNAKLHFRRAICLMNLNLLQEARCDLAKVQDLDPDSKEQVQRQLKVIQKMQAIVNKESKQIYKKFFK